ncbi:MAG TPA: lysophospholipid acyltransferase family protein [Stellaceae bacterium]|jgi:hypothetical protein
MRRFKDHIRRFRRSAWPRALLCWLIQLYIRLVFATNRWRVEGGDIPARLSDRPGGLILAFWHGRMLMIPRATPRLAPVQMLISGHPDGQLIAGAVRYFDIGYIAGSSRRGGLRASLAMARRLRAGDWVGITPDPPGRPARAASLGVVKLAQLARTPIVPLVFATSRHRKLNTRDKFYLALPFGRGIYIWGEPIEIAAELDADGLESARRLVELRMNELADEADRRVTAPAARRASAMPAREPG